MGYFDDRDGRRKSDPLKSLDTGPALAPDWQLCRVVTAQDVAFTTRRHGMNCGHHKSVRFSVVPYDSDPRDEYGPTPPAPPAPGGSANPNVEAMIWDEGSQSFLSFPTPITGTGVGAGSAYLIDVPNANGAIIFLAVTNDPAGEYVAIYSQAYDMNHTL